MILDNTITLKETSKMNEYVEKSLYDILDKYSTRLVQLYYVNSWQLGDLEGMNVAGNILYKRNYYNE